MKGWRYQGSAMVVDLTLLPETEARLRQQAAAAGKEPAVLIRETVEARFGPAQSFADILRPIHEEVRASGMSEQELDGLLATTLEQVRRERRGGQHGG